MTQVAWQGRVCEKEGPWPFFANEWDKNLCQVAGVNDLWYKWEAFLFIKQKWLKMLQVKEFT